MITTLARPLATALAMVAALAFVLDGALGSDHHRAAPWVQADSHQHAHNHDHGHSAAAAHHHHHHHHHPSPIAAVTGAVSPADHDSVPPPADAGGCRCCSASCCAVVLPVLTAVSVALIRQPVVAGPDRRRADGVEPDGLRRPPRPIAIT